jgi:predicted metallopeptidase
MSDYDEKAALRKALQSGIPQAMVDALTKKFPTHGDEEDIKAITKELADAPRTTAEQLRELKAMQRERREGVEGMERVLAARMHTYGENCPHCESSYCLAFPNWSKPDGK